MDKYKNKYRIPSARAQWWDYGRDAAYFVTICTRHRECFFGEIHDHEMILSPAGRIADFCWAEIIDHAKNIELGPYVVMPNHVHGIVILAGDHVEPRPAERQGRPCLYLSPPPPHQTPAPIQILHPYQDPRESNKSIGQIRFQHPGKDTLSKIIGGYKSGVSRDVHYLRSDFGWQTRFHDHIIRDEEEYQRIAEYILNNPANWKEDKFYSP